MGILIKNISTYLPEKKLYNQYFESFLDTSDEWIKKRTGINSRYFSDKDVTEMSIMCTKKLLEKQNNSKISLIISSSFTDKNRMPSVSASVANYFGLFGKIRTLDINVACSGFVSAVDLADSLLKVGEFAIIIGAEQISEYLDMSDRGTAILFGDGAGAILIEKISEYEEASFGIVKDENYLYLDKENKIRMDGKEVFKFAVKYLKDSISGMLKKYGDVDYIVCHQANERILDNVSNKLEIDSKKFYKNVDQVGNTSSASIPLLLNKMKSENCFNQRSSILLCGFGAGLVYYNKHVEIECNDEI